MNYTTDAAPGICPVPLMQNKWEFESLLSIYEKIKPRSVLEIGSFYGGTLFHWIARNHSLKYLTVIDMPIGAYDTRFKEMQAARRQWYDWVGASNIKTFSSIEALSQDRQTVAKVAEMHFMNPIEFLFIDGGHKYDEVRADYQNYSGLVSSGGCIAFHDIAGIDGVSKFWDELKGAGHSYVEIVSQKNPTKMGIGVIFK